jgi:hypothetical protein
MLQCDRHYFQNRSAGNPPKVDPNKPQFNGRYIIASGYVLVKDTEHPLRDKRNYVYEHRKVAYDKHGPGPHDCEWCGITLEWKDIQVDHLDWNRQNNAPENLRISCQPCNGTRTEVASQEKAETAKRTSARLRDLVRRLNN